MLRAARNRRAGPLDAAELRGLHDLAVVPLGVGRQCRPQPAVPAVGFRVSRVRVVRLAVAEDADEVILSRPPLRFEDVFRDLPGRLTALLRPLLADREELLLFPRLDRNARYRAEH